MILLRVAKLWSKNSVAWTMKWLAVSNNLWIRTNVRVVILNRIWWQHKFVETSNTLNVTHWKAWTTSRKSSVCLLDIVYPWKHIREAGIAWCLDVSWNFILKLITAIKPEGKLLGWFLSQVRRGSEVSNSWPSLLYQVVALPESRCRSKCTHRCILIWILARACKIIDRSRIIYTCFH